MNTFPEKAMIFAAGLGTRLKPFTDTVPKGMIRVGTKTMLENVIEKLINTGIRSIIINIHHHADKIREYISSLNYPNTELVISDESEQLLDTGGGLLNALDHFKGGLPFFIYNVDVLCDIDLRAMYNSFREKEYTAVLAVSNRVSSRYLLVDENNRLSGWENTKTGEKIMCRQNTGKLKRRAFSGIHLANPRLPELFTAKGSFPILPEYLRLAAKHNIYCHEHNPDLWADIGTPEKLMAARRLFEENPDKFF